MTNTIKTVSFNQPGKVKIINGSVLAPENAGLRFVLSVNNLSGKIDNNPLYPLFENKWKKVKEDAKGWFATKTGAYKLGATNTTAVQSDTWVIHMLCQDEKQVTDLNAVEECLKKVCANAKYEKATVHVSSLLLDYIPELSKLITKHLVESGVSVSYYQEK